MANFKSAKNLLRQRDEYARYFTDFRGVDFSSDHTEVADNRFAYLVNMYKDYNSGVGGAIETIPGFRRIGQFSAKINGIHVGGGRMYVHCGTLLYYIADLTEEKGVNMLGSNKLVGYLADAKSVSFNYSGKTYILDGVSYNVILELEDGHIYLENVLSVSYLPTTHRGIDLAALTDTVAEDIGEGYEYEQRNLLNAKYKTTYIADGDTANFDLKQPIDTDWYFESNRDVYAKFSSEFDVYQYGVRLPLAYRGNGGQPTIPEGYPNAIWSVESTGAGGANGRVRLCRKPPKPEHNTWNPVTRSFDYAQSDIDKGVPDENDYEWPFAFYSTYPGIEVVVTRKITAVGGVEVADNWVNDYEKIISKCTIVAIHDNHVFLSGNPDFPRHIFWNAIKGDDSGVPDATFFGESNFTLAGMSESPVVALMSVGDSLMVLKKDGDEEESILLLNSALTSSDVVPLKYPSTRGHRGLGSLGPCHNFRDDPVFLTKYGVDALGNVSTKYRRAIKHRSTLVDAKLLNSDLSNASIAEWNGYLMILIEGKIFMADSRQMYNTDSGNTEYEWYYLEDIGVYNNQFDEYVYAELPVNLTKEEMLEITGGVELLEASAVRDEYGVMRDLIGTSAFESENEITFIKNGDGDIYYKEIAEIDEYGLETGRVLKYYVEPSGGKTGGAFDPAVLLKAVADDLFFGTEGGALCKFNFDMRDKESGVIPNEYYDFNGRTIFSGCATKMDNCGIPHLTKTTVKRSMVLKTRMFKHSGAKIKIRTNKKDFTQVGRIISGRATFEDPDFKTYSFSTNDTSIFSINEREKKWVEKQIFVFSDGYRCPIAIHYLAYRYNVAGRYKE